MILSTAGGRGLPAPGRGSARGGVCSRGGEEGGEEGGGRGTHPTGMHCCLSILTNVSSEIRWQPIHIYIFLQYDDQQVFSPVQHSVVCDHKRLHSPLVFQEVADENIKLTISLT